MRRPRWDIFCTVVDNYGDIGVCWRLARQLAVEHGIDVRLWLDDLRALALLWPEADVTIARQQLAGVEVCHWCEPLPTLEPADVVIEAFACELPAAYVEAMAQRAKQSGAGRARPPVWINLEYLSAEDWVAGCHGLPSQHPQWVLTKYFFFPGFDAASGGLLREVALLDERRAFQQNPALIAQFLGSLGLGEAVAARRLSLFAYENSAVAPLLDHLAAGKQAWWVLLPPGRVVPDVERWLGETASISGHYRRGAVTVAALPFLRQTDYDRLLWSCDLNAVRGEDSLVRALWAGRPLLWQIYPQADAAHLDKLDAFLERYLPTLSVWQQVNRAWNGDGDVATAWQQTQPQWEALQARAQQWADQLAAQPDLARALVRFCANRL